MSLLGMGTHGKDFQQQSASAVYSTFEELQSTTGGLRKDSSSMNMDEFLKNIWTAEGSHAMAVALGPPVASAAARAHADLQRQSSLTLPRTISQKIVDEVWFGLIRESASGAGGSESQHQPTLGEMTLEDFLVRAGVVREEINSSVTGSVYHGELSASGNNNADLTVMPSSSIPANSGANFAMPALAGMMRYAPQLPLDSNVDLGSTQGMRGGGFCGIGYPEISNGFIPRAVGLGGGEGVSVARANQIPSDWQTKGNGDLSSLSPVPYTCGGGMRGRKRSGVVEKVVERRQRRMIKNRESASRSRARKQAYMLELEAEVAKLKEQNQELQKKQVWPYGSGRLAEVVMFWRHYLLQSSWMRFKIIKLSGLCHGSSWVRCY